MIAMDERTQTPQRSWLTISEAAEILGVSRAWVQIRIKANPKKVGAYRLEQGPWRIDKVKFEQYQKEITNSEVNEKD